MIGIYAVKCLVNGKLYIGQSIDIKRRFKFQKQSLKSNRNHNRYLQEDYNNYGKDNFEYIVLLEIPKEKYNSSYLDNLEKEQILKYMSCNRQYGYNIEKGGNKSKEVSEETKKLLSQSHIGLGVGSKRNEQTKKLMSEHSYKYWLGKKMPIEVRNKMSLTRKGKPSHKKGKPISEKTKQKISKSQIGSKWVYKGNESHFIKEELLEKYLSNGFQIGRPHFKRKRN